MVKSFTTVSEVSVYREEIVYDPLSLIDDGSKTFKKIQSGFAKILYGDSVVADIRLIQSDDEITSGGSKYWKKLSDNIIARNWYGEEQSLGDKISSSLDQLNRLIESIDSNKEIDYNPLSVSGADSWDSLFEMIVSRCSDSKFSLKVDNSNLPDYNSLCRY